MGSNIERLFYILSAVLLFLSISFPITLIELKALFLLLLLSMCLFIRKVFFLSPQVLMLSFIYSIVGLLWVLYGIVRGNPGALSMITVLVIYPLIFGVLSSIYNPLINEKLHFLFIKIAWFLALSTLLIIVDFIWLHLGFYNLIISLYGTDAVVIDNSMKYFKFTIPNISSLIFLIPYLISVILFRRSNASSVLLFMALCSIALLSGRRALLLTMLVAPAISVILTSDRFSKTNLLPKFLIVTLALGGMTSFFYVTYPEYFSDRIFNIFNFDTNESNLERRYQFDALMAGFYEHPIFGNGAGAVAGYIRSDAQPWAYELSYIAFLFQFGCLGILIYTSGTVFILYTLINKVKMHGRNSMEFCYLSGFVSFLIANATNPYLLKFDYMWLVFIPVGIANSSFAGKIFLKDKS